MLIWPCDTVHPKTAKSSVSLVRRSSVKIKKKMLEKS